MNNNRSDERALQAGCKGAFSTTSYITIGSKGKAEDYVKKIPDHPRFGGKQIGVAWPKAGKTVDTYFQKEHKWVYNGCKFNDRLMYASQQSKPTRGFMTSDYHRRDEFSLDFRTEQYREQLKMEDKYAKRALDQLRTHNAADGAADDEAAPRFGITEGIDKPFLYDLVFEENDAAHTGASKVHRDTKNPTWHSKDRKFGDMRTTMHIAHGPPDAACFTKPQFANKPLIRDTFYRRTNVQFPDNCAAVNVDLTPLCRSCGWMHKRPALR